MTAHDADEWRAALYGQPETDGRPEPYEYADSLNGPTTTTGCNECGSAWPKPLCNCDYVCGRCGENEVKRRGEPCGECIADMEQEEAHDRSRPGEW